jgi:hypothetical protein
VDDGTKVKADRLDHPLAVGNATFDGGTVKLFGVRNETVAFQVILQGGSQATSDVDVQLPSIGPIKNTNVSDDPDRYFMGRSIELFQQIYQNVTERSNGLVWSNPSSAAVPKGWLGPVPDPLVPLDLLTSAMSVPANRNQGVWVDVYIPKGTPAGTHRGTLTVRVDGQVCSLAACQIAVELEVKDYTLPDDPPVKTMLWFSGGDADQVLSRYFPAGSGGAAAEQALRDRHYKLARRHLVTLFLGEASTPNDQIKARLSGQTFSAANGYDGWGVGKGQDMYSIHTYGGTLNAVQAKTWSDWFKANAPNATYFLYTWDEPHGNYSAVNDIARNCDPVPGFVTSRYRSEMPDMDIFAALANEYDQSNRSAANQAGKKLWIYNAVRPHSGSFAIDDVGVSPRVNPWVQHKYKIERWFIWESTYYNDFQGSRGQIDVFENPLNFTNRHGDRVNGDGLLIYPGTDLRFPAHNYGFAGPLPSIRLKNWRRGIQDVGYLKALEGAGRSDLVQAALTKLIPSVLDDRGRQQAVSWPEDGDVWLEERRKLADALPKGPQPPPVDGGVTPPKDGGSSAPDAAGPAPKDGGASGVDSGSNTLYGDGGCALSCPVAAGSAVPLVLFALLLVVLRMRSKRS